MALPFTLGPERVVSDPPVGPAPAGGARASAASDGTNLFVAWISGAEVRGMRLGPGGQRLDDRLGIRISRTNARFHRGPAVIFDGEVYVVAWVAQEPVLQSFRLYAARVTQAGEVIGSEDLDIDSTIDLPPSLASDGTVTMISNGVSRTYRLNDGTLDPPPIPLGGRVRFDGTSFICFSEDGTGRRFTASGTLLDAQPWSTLPGGRLGDVGCDGAGECLVMGAFGDSAACSTALAVRVRNGIIQDGAPISPSTAPERCGAQSVAFDGRRYVVTVSTSTASPTTFVSAVDRMGQVSTIGQFPFTGLTTSPTRFAQAAGASWLVGHVLDGDAWQTIAARIAGRTLVDDPPILISQAPLPQRHPALAGDGGGRFLAAWQEPEHPGQARGIFARPLDASGSATGPKVRVATVLPSAIDPIYPRLSHDGSVYWMAWNDGGALLAQRLSPAGAPLDATPLVLDGGGAFQLVSAAGQTLAVWSRSTQGDRGWRVYGARLASDGTQLGATFRLSTVESVQLNPAVGTDGAGFLTVWEDRRFGDSDYASVYGGRVSQAGQLLDATQNLPLMTSMLVANPAVAFDGSAWVVVVMRPSDEPWVLRVGSDGVPTTAFGTVAQPASGTERRLPLAPGLTFVGDGTLLTFGHPSITLMRIPLTGSDLEAPLVLTDAGEWPGIAATGMTGRALALWDRTTPQHTIVAREVGPTHACASASDCPAGTPCVDGYCCDSACGGGISTDCQACSVAAGAAANGACGPVAIGRSCRPATGACDVAEVCNGTSLDCPEDLFVATGTQCRAAVDGCDVAEACTGSTAACPPDTGGACPDAGAGAAGTGGSGGSGAQGATDAGVTPQKRSGCSSVAAETSPSLGWLLGLLVAMRRRR